jgi:hypothetical protein
MANKPIRLMDGVSIKNHAGDVIATGVVVGRAFGCPIRYDVKIGITTRDFDDDILKNVSGERIELVGKSSFGFYV